MLILVCGLPGTGKSLVAKEISRNLPDTVVLRTDVLRKTRTKTPRYTKKEKDLVYKDMFVLAEQVLSKNRNCVLDATFYKRELREAAKELASRNRTGFIIIETVCPEDIVRKRLKERTQKKDVSDADFSVYEKIKNGFEKIEEEHITISTHISRKKLQESVKDLIREITTSQHNA